MGRHFREVSTREALPSRPLFNRHDDSPVRVGLHFKDEFKCIYLCTSISADDDHDGMTELRCRYVPPTGEGRRLRRRHDVIQLSREHVESNMQMVPAPREWVLFKVGTKYLMPEEYEGVKVQVRNHGKGVAEPYSYRVTWGDPVTGERRKVEYWRVYDNYVPYK